LDIHQCEAAVHTFRKASLLLKSSSLKCYEMTRYYYPIIIVIASLFICLWVSLFFGTTMVYICACHSGIYR